eukprot:scaffold30581_cov105-Phaeocystis_antarctica.AAC.2
MVTTPPAAPLSLVPIYKDPLYGISPLHRAFVSSLASHRRRLSANPGWRVGGARSESAQAQPYRPRLESAESRRAACTPYVHSEAATPGSRLITSARTRRRSATGGGCGSRRRRRAGGDTHTGIGGILGRPTTTMRQPSFSCGGGLDRLGCGGRGELI